MEGLVRHSPLQSMIHGSLVETLFHALCYQRRCPTKIILLTEILHTCWVERNAFARQWSHFCFPIQHIIQSALLQVEALRLSTRAATKIRVLHLSFENLSSLMDLVVFLNDQQNGIQ